MSRFCRKAVHRQGCCLACRDATTGPLTVDQLGDTKHFAIPQTPYIDKVVDTPVVMHQQLPQVVAVHRQQVTKLVEIPPTQHTDKVVGVPAVMRRQVPQLQTARKTWLTMCQCLRS